MTKWFIHYLFFTLYFGFYDEYREDSIKYKVKNKWLIVKNGRL